jgi:hypothetical protein
MEKEETGKCPKQSHLQYTIDCKANAKNNANPNKRMNMQNDSLDIKLNQGLKLTVAGLGLAAEFRRSPLLLLTCRTGRFGGGRGCCGLCRPDTTCDHVGIEGLTGVTTGTTAAGPEDSILPTLRRLYLVAAL